MRLLLIGGGKGGAALLSAFGEYRDISIIGVVDRNEKAEGMLLAKEMNIPVSTDFESLVKKGDIDLIVNVTGVPEVSKRIRTLAKDDIEIIGGEGARFLWHLIEEKSKKEQEAKERLLEQEILYKIGIMLSSAERSEEVLSVIVENAIKLSDAAAGSLVLFEEETGEMTMACAKGFSDEFSSVKRWKWKAGGMTGRILDSAVPTIVRDISKDRFKHNPILLKEGVQSFMAVPLRAEGKIVGILYINDFRPRDFTRSQVSIVSLLANQASFAIENIMLLERTEQLAITDELTKLFNHRHFVKSLADEIKRAKRYKQNLSVCMIDVDFFKSYNDTHGHLAGNDVLKEISRIMKENVRDIDTVARYGGEEFAVLMPQTTKEKASLTAERIREAVADFKFPNGHTQPGGRVSISIGVATFPNDGDTTSEVVGRADEAMYRAKKEGKNRVCVFGK